MSEEEDRKNKVKKRLDKLGFKYTGKYIVSAYDFETGTPFRDDKNTEIDNITEARKLSKKQAKQWCETQYGKKIVKEKPVIPNSFLEGYTCSDVGIEGSVIMRTKKVLK
jgi:hypothetical protein